MRIKTYCIREKLIYELGFTEYVNIIYKFYNGIYVIVTRTNDIFYGKMVSVINREGNFDIAFSLVFEEDITEQYNLFKKDLKYLEEKDNIKIEIED